MVRDYKSNIKIKIKQSKINDNKSTSYHSNKELSKEKQPDLKCNHGEFTQCHLSKLAHSRSFYAQCVMYTACILS